MPKTKTGVSVSSPQPCTCSKNDGWNGSPLYFERSHTDLKPGTWRLRVTGVAGPDKVPWESEFRTIQVIVPGAKQSRPGTTVLGNLLRSVVGAPDLNEAVTTADERTKRKVILDGEAF